MGEWMWNGCELTEPFEGAYGYLYAIYIPPLGKVYFGKKAFTHSRKKRVTKKEIKETKTRKRVRNVVLDSQWRNYYGSNKELLEWIKINGTEGIERIVLGFAKTKQDLSYWETELLIREEVLFRDDCLNGNIGGKFFKNKINKLIQDVNIH